jgi:hypothetical protein
MKRYILILFLLIANLTFADEPRISTLFKSENQKFILQLSKNNIWLLKNSNGTTVYSIKDKNYTCMSALISNDGNKIVVINDFVEGHKVKQTMALTFYYRGRLVREYKLEDLIDDSTNVSLSIWHTTWCIDDFGFEMSDSVFSIATYEFNEISFSTFTGEISCNKKPYPFDHNTLIVKGNFYVNEESDSIKMSITKYIYGVKQDNNTIAFRGFFGKGNWENEILMIKNGVDVTPLRYRRILF